MVLLIQIRKISLTLGLLSYDAQMSAGTESTEYFNFLSISIEISLTSLTWGNKSKNSC